MFANGFLEEVRGLLEMGYSPALPTMSAIGYRECVAVLEGQIQIEEAKQRIGRATRIFVRRQANWFKESDPTISWFRVEVGVMEKIEAFIRQSLSTRANADRWSHA
jgi:tRNA dimethylallyltransferase